MPDLFIGVDGGGTHTRAAVAGADLVPKGRGSAGPANAATRPLPRVLAAVTEAVDDAALAAGVAPSAAVRIACGLAGIDTAGIADRVQGALGEVYGAGKVLVTNDARIALAGAIDGPLDAPGVVLIAGTGAIAFGRNRLGVDARAGGWGPVIGDEGSGYAVARRGLAAVVRDLDGRGPGTKIRELLFASEGMRTADELLSRIYRTDGGPADVASYFPLVVAAARQGDSVARTLLEEAGAELALAAISVVRKLGLENESFTVAVVGGVFSAGELVLARLRATLLGVAPNARLAPPARPPEIGAIRLAVAAAAASAVGA
jgi:N-acetylglucosamine kinase-like BadF-type ATPase